MNEKDEKLVIVKINLPKNLKLQFKILCMYKDLTMSNVIGELIEKWIQNNAYTDNFISEPSRGDGEELKGYIPKTLKTNFRILCIKKEITMRHVLYNLIRRWVIAENNS